MPTIADLLKRAQVLDPVSDTPRLDVEVLLCHVLDKPRNYLYAWPEYVLEQQALTQFKYLFARRIAGEPIAHLSGQKEFWSLSLDVNASTLIPRPETELLVETALNLFNESKIDNSKFDSAIQVLDLGTGTGAIALALASERPNWNVLAVDSSADAVKLAESNRTRLDFDNVQIDQSDWFENVNADRRFDLIVSNPPYIAPDDRHLSEGDVRFEPRSALVANDAGFADIETIILNASEFLVRGGWLLLEHGSEQGEGVRELLKAHLDDVTTWRDVAGLERVSGGRVPIGEV
ncbi:MAG: peptide chain release factor N(5)-glutamine methyltransferase [Porticoccaceae bacterium]|nr:peptide chain release factor N(5)-glutamine methyltransferase [Porticoccaceae bacterium]